MKKESEKFGVEVNKAGTNAPPAAQLKAYRAAMWGAFAFGMFGALLAAMFLRSVGIVGHSDEDEKKLREDEETSRDEKGRDFTIGDDTGSERTQAPRLSEESQKREEKQTEQRVEQ